VISVERFSHIREARFGDEMCSRFRLVAAKMCLQLNRVWLSGQLRLTCRRTEESGAEKDIPVVLQGKVAAEVILCNL
jgi:hypothetical protein